MISLINNTFAEWTGGLDTRQSMISIFSHIRDIPYSFWITAHDPKKQAEQLLELGKGSCGPKHYLLAEMFRKMNLSVIYATIAFSWNDPDLHYPSELRKYAALLPIAHHLACRVQIGCRWVLVDATWDPPLARGGFPINDPWDGYSEMKWAVKPLRSPAGRNFAWIPAMRHAGKQTILNYGRSTAEKITGMFMIRHDIIVESSLCAHLMRCCRRRSFTGSVKIGWSRYGIRYIV